MDRPADTPADTTPDTYAESSERLMDYLRSLPEPTCATCGADAVDAHGGSLPLVQRLRPLRWYPKTRQLAKRESSS